MSIMAVADYLYLIFIFSMSFKFYVAKEFIPVFFWSDQSYLQGFEIVPASQHLNFHDFNHLYTSKLVKSHPKVIVTFIQDKFSLEDLVEYGNVYGIHSNQSAFQNLKKFMDGDSFMLPGVAHPSHSLQFLKSHLKGNIYELEGNQTAAGLDLDPKHTNLIVVRLPSAKHSYFQMTTNDARIGQIMKDIQEVTSHYIAFFTADKSSKVHIPEDSVSHTGRHLLADQAPYPKQFRFIINATCVLMVAQDIIVSIKNKSGPDNVYSLPHSDTLEADTSETVCHNETPKFVFHYKDIHGVNVTSFTSLKVTFNFNVSKFLRNWHFLNGHVEIDIISPTTKSLNISINVPPVLVSRNFSYHCSRPYPMSTKTGENATTDNSLSLTFTEFQIQPLDLENGKFSDWDDCAEFFSIGIWMGLFVSAILLIILFSGVVMNMSIKSMDRFDDAKRKTITVTNAE